MAVELVLLDPARVCCSAINICVRFAAVMDRRAATAIETEELCWQRAGENNGAAGPEFNKAVRRSGFYGLVDLQSGWVGRVVKSRVQCPHCQKYWLIANWSATHILLLLLSPKLRWDHPRIEGVGWTSSVILKLLLWVVQWCWLCGTDFSFIDFCKVCCGGMLWVGAAVPGGGAPAATHRAVVVPTIPRQIFRHEGKN